MKPIRFSKILGRSRTTRSFRFALVTPAIVLTLATAQAGTPAPAPAPTPPAPASNWIDLTIGGAFVSGNDAGMMARTQTNGDFYGGISDSYFSKALNDSTTLTIDGHAIPGLEDYEGHLLLNKQGLGYLKVGYDQFRTWYDGSGGAVPGVAGGWIPLYDDELSVDRGEFMVELGLRMENLPEVTFGYSHEWREGSKDSTSWGRSAATLLPPGAAAGVSFAIVPTLYNIDEASDTFTLDIAHTLGNTDLDLGLRYESDHNHNSLVVRREPGATTLANDRTNIQTNIYDADLFSGHLSSESRLNDRMLLSFGYAYSTMDTDSDGSSRYQRTAANVVTWPGIDYGSGSVTSNTLNANFWWNPIDDLVVVPAVFASWEESDMNNYNAVTKLKRQSNDSSFDQLGEEVEVRYTGIEDLVLYAKGEFSQDDSDYTLASVNGDLRLQTSEINQEKYVVGANWYPLQGVSLSAQYFNDNYEQDYGNSYTTPGAGANAFDAQLKTHNYNTDDVNLRLSWRALPNLTLVSRYDYQQTTMENQAYLQDGRNTIPSPLFTGSIDSADITQNIFSESVTWSPISRLYLQGTVSYVLAQTDTPADAARYYIADSDNDYLTASLTVGYAIDDKTSLTGAMTYYGASNYSAITYDAAKSANFGSGSYGYETEEFGVSVALSRMLTENMIWNLRYGYINSNTDGDDQTGGNNDFDAHMISTGLQIRF
jgi:hypothetical protein